MNSKRKIAIAASVLAAFTSIVLITAQANASNSAPVTPPTVTSQTVPSVTSDVAGVTSDLDGVDVQSGDQSALDVVGATSESDDATDVTDDDTTQSGD